MNDQARSWSLKAAMVASVLAGAIHVVAGRSHLATSRSAFAFFAIVAMFQFAWATAARASASRSVWTAGIAVNASVAVVWFVSRTAGIPGHHGGHPEAVGLLDLTATALEAFVVGACFALRREPGAVRTAGRNHARVAWAAAAALAALAAPLQVGAGESVHVARRPHPTNVLEAYAKGRVVALTYAGYHCTMDPFDDLDGPGHEGDGTPAVVDRDEIAAGTPCIIGKTRHGSVPKVDPAGGDASTAARLYGLIPNFDSDGDGVVEYLDQTPTGEYHCPQPGPPVSARKGEFPGCPLHPPAHIEPFLRTIAGSTSGADVSSVDVPEAVLAGSYHSHVIEYTSSPRRWWNAVVFNVDDESVFPDAEGRCPAKRGCLTSVAAIRAGQKAGKVQADVPTNVWFLFSVRPVA